MTVSLQRTSKASYIEPATPQRALFIQRTLFNRELDQVLDPAH
ncbi:hypothetical protein [Agromyces badenianii]|nr:hypothetical protein [Agromyces badenianii]